MDTEGNDDILRSLALGMDNTTKNRSTYEQACNFLTIQSNSKGFFRDFCSKVNEVFVNKGKLHEFGKLATNEERISQLFAMDDICSVILEFMNNVTPVYRVKCEKTAENFRMKANKIVLNNTTDEEINREDLKNSLRILNISVLRAPAKEKGGEPLAVALMSRAAILLGLGNGAAAFNDLKFAVDVSPSTKKTYDYYSKLAKCYIYMNDFKRAEISLKLVEKLGKVRNADFEFCREKLLNYHKMVGKGQYVAPTAAADVGKSPEYPMLANGEHAKFKSASSLVTLEENPRKGRFMVAGSKISTGDVLLCEEPVAACLDHRYFGDYCHHCFVKLVITIPCLDCAGVAFCSVECMRASCETYHRYECKFMDMFIGSGMSVLCFIALKIFAQSPNIEEAFKVSESLYNNLCGHLKERSADDHLNRSLMAVFIMRCLQKTGYFGERNVGSPMPTDVEMKACAHLLGLLQILQYNSHEIYTIQYNGGHIIDNLKVVYIGAGIYKTGALFNHECWPTVTRYFVGKRLVLTAIKPHAPGEVLAENYGPIFSKMDAKQRQANLKARYLFDCNCLPCIRKWPILDKMDASIRWRCSTPNCANTFSLAKTNWHPTCRACRKKLDFTTNFIVMQKVEQWYIDAAECMMQQNVDRATELFTTALNAFFEMAVLPHKNTMLAQLSFLKCLSAPRCPRND